MSNSVIPVSVQRRLSWFVSMWDPGRASAPDSATQANRARWHRQASLTTSVGIVAKAVAIGVRFVTIPLALRLLGSERYGLWLSLGSVLAWIGFVGPGLGYGLINALSDASGRDDVPTMRRHVSTAFFTIWTLGLLLLASIPALTAWSGWAGLLGVEGRPDLTGEALALISVAATVFVLSFSLEFIGPVCAGLQEGYLSSVASVAASLLVLVGVVFLAIEGGTLVTFALVVGLPPIVTNLALSVYVLWRRYPELRPSWRLWNRESFASLMGFGGWMFLGQMGELAIFQSANILIANRFGPGEVPRYAVPAALFMNLANVCYLIVQPYWPALKEASVREDWDWIRTAMSRTLKFRVAMMICAGGAIVLGGPTFIRLWAGEQGVPNRSLLVAMSVYYVLVAWSGNYVVLLFGLGLVRIKTFLTLLVGLAHVGGFFLLSPHVGLSAIPLGGAIGVAADGFLASRAASRHIREQINKAAARRRNSERMLNVGATSKRSPPPLVTIVIPYHHNYAQYLEACLESIRQQTYTNWEAILVDDASVGETAEAVVGKLADARFSIIRHERNRGQAAARNTGIRSGSGTFVMPVDCDDLLAPTHLEKLMRALEEHRHCGAAYADFNLFFAASGVLEFPVRDTRALLREQWIPHPGTVVRRVLWERANGYREDEIFRTGNEDWDYFLAIAEIDLQAVRVPEPLYQYRQHENLDHDEPVRLFGLPQSRGDVRSSSDTLRPVRDEAGVPRGRLPRQRRGLLAKGRVRACVATARASVLALAARLRRRRGQETAPIGVQTNGSVWFRHKCSDSISQVRICMARQLFAEVDRSVGCLDVSQTPRFRGT